MAHTHFYRVVAQGCLQGSSALLPADDAPEASAEPCEDPPEEPREAFRIRLVTPPTTDPTMLPMNPKKSDPPC